MGIVRTDESKRAEIEQFRRLLLSPSGVWRSKDVDRRPTAGEWKEEPQEKVVCVTSGVSYLGLAIVNQLLIRGYFVRIIADNEGDIFRHLLFYLCFLSMLLIIRFITF